MHRDQHPQAGQEVAVLMAIDDPYQDIPAGSKGRLEDWWDRVYGKSWATSDGNPAALKYGVRSAIAGLPLDDEVVYVKIDGLGHLLHQSEIKAGA